MSNEAEPQKGQESSKARNRNPFAAEGIIRSFVGPQNPDYDVSIAFATVPPEGWFGDMSRMDYTLVNAEVSDVNPFDTGDVANFLESEIGDIDYKRANGLARGPFNQQVVYDFDYDGE